MNSDLRGKLVPVTLPGQGHVLVDCFKSSQWVLDKLGVSAGMSGSQDRGGGGGGGGGGEQRLVRFLSHYHADHYSGLSGDWGDGEVHCSAVTGRLLVRAMGVRQELVVTHELNEWVDFGGFRVALVDANHCPGAVLLLFQRSGPGAAPMFLHTGDMRFRDEMRSEPLLQQCRGRLDAVYLDTTYADPKHAFPPQSTSIELAREAVQEFEGRAREGQRTLVLVCSYTIGKEKLVFGLCDKLGARRVHLAAKKRVVMECVGLPPERLAMLVEDPAAPVHLVAMRTVATMHPYYQPAFDKVEAYLDQVNAALPKGEPRFHRAVAVLPTGWAVASNYNKRNANVDNAKDDAPATVQVSLVPYSEHSNFAELKEMCTFLRPVQIVPTVFRDAADYDKIVKRFHSCVDSKEATKRFFQGAAHAPAAVDKPANVSAPAIVDNPPTAVVEVPGPCQQLQQHEQQQQHEACAPAPAPASASAPQWACGACTLLNAPLAVRCAVCDNLRGSTLGSAASSSATEPQAKRPNPRKSAAGSPCAAVKRKSAKRPADQGTLTSFFSKRLARSDDNSAPRLAPVVAPADAAGAASGMVDIVREVRRPESEPQLGPEQAPQPPQQQQQQQQQQCGEQGDATTSSPILSFSLLADALCAVGATSKGLEKLTALVNLFRTAIVTSRRDAEQVSHVVMLSLGLFANQHEPFTININYSSVKQAVQNVTCVSDRTIRKAREDGTAEDFGDRTATYFAAKRSNGTLPFKPASSSSSAAGASAAAGRLSVGDVFRGVVQMGSFRGPGAEQRRRQRLERLLHKCGPQEARFLVKMILSDQSLRVGATETTVLKALVEAVLWAAAGAGAPRPKKETTEATVKACLSAFGMAPHFGFFVQALLEAKDLARDGLAGAVTMRHGVPVRPMTAEPSHGLDAILSKFGGQAFSADHKLDGERVQVHMWSSSGAERAAAEAAAEDAGTEVRVCTFSRQCKSNTGNFPDIVQTMLQQRRASVRSCIVDAEVVAIDRSCSPPKIGLFQELKGRDKSGSGSKGAAVFAFDLLELNGRSLLDAPLRERRKLLAESFSPKEGWYDLAPHKNWEPGLLQGEGPGTDAYETRADEMLELFQDALTAHAEGLMVKLLDSPYVPNKRVNFWLKCKQDYLKDTSQRGYGALRGGGLSDTLDLVPIAAWHGSGRKNRWWSPFLMASFDPVSGQYRAVCKVMSGFSNEQYEAFNAFFEGHCADGTPRSSASAPINVVGLRSGAQGPQPAVWFQPDTVWEIRGAELTRSPAAAACLAAGADGRDRGLSVRFPRFMRVLDKRPDQAATEQDLERLWEGQTRK